MLKKIVSFVLIIGLVLFGASTASAYTVKDGDTLSGIAEEQGLSLDTIIDYNPQIRDVNLIYIGDEINTYVKEINSKDAKEDEAVEENTTKETTAGITQSELDVFARLVEAEAKGESYMGKVAVAEVVLNRIESPSFPDTIEGVIYQQGQFTPVDNTSINNTPSKDSINAVDEALQGTNLTNGALYFWHPEIASNKWLNNKSTTVRIGVHEFKK